MAMTPKYRKCGACWTCSAGDMLAGKVDTKGWDTRALNVDQTSRVCVPSFTGANVQAHLTRGFLGPHNFIPAERHPDRFIRFIGYNRVPKTHNKNIASSSLQHPCVLKQTRNFRHSVNVGNCAIAAERRRPAERNERSSGASNITDATPQIHFISPASEYKLQQPSN